MAIPGIDPNGSANLPATSSANYNAAQTPTQKLAEAKAEATKDINDGDEQPATGANVNKLV